MISEYRHFTAGYILYIIMFVTNKNLEFLSIRRKDSKAWLDQGFPNLVLESLAPTCHYTPARQFLACLARA